jgi:hypothetical protein
MKNRLLYLAKEPPNIRPMGNMLVSRPTKNIACPRTTQTYPMTIFKYPVYESRGDMKRQTMIIAASGSDDKKVSLMV